MGGLEFDEAYALLLSTMPGAQIFDCDVHPAPEQPLKTTGRAATVIFYEPKLSTSLRQIQDWTFLLDNRFLAQAVQKIAILWVMHEGGIKFGEPALVQALRHCFKRFYAESLVALGPPPLGRALLLESILFERHLIEEAMAIARRNDDDEARPVLRATFELTDQALILGRYHEMAHLVVREKVETPAELSRRHLDGLAAARLGSLAAAGHTALAEEIYCDLVALDFIIQTAAEPSIPLLYCDHVKRALFAYTLLSTLTQVHLIALQHARHGWDAAESGEPPPDLERPRPYRLMQDRLLEVTALIRKYVRSRGGRLYERDGRFYLNDRFDNLLAGASRGFERLAGQDPHAVVSEQQRELARFLALPMAWTDEVSAYLINSARNRELQGWIRDDPPVAQD